MDWELYEVWTVDVDGHEDLVDTTKSLKEAKEIAQDALDINVDAIKCIIYRETETGDLEQIDTVS